MMRATPPKRTESVGRPLAVDSKAPSTFGLSSELNFAARLVYLPAANYAQTTSESALEERNRVRLMAALRLRSRPAVLLHARPSPAQP